MRRRRIELNAAHQRAEEAVDHPVAEALLFERAEGGDVGLAKQLGGAGAHQADSLAEDARLVGGRTDRSERGPQQRTRAPEWITDEIGRRAVPHERAGLEPTRVERVEIELGRQLRIGSEQYLEAPVEAEPVDDVGADTASDPVGCLQHHDIAASTMDGVGGCQTRQPGPYDHHFGVRRERPAVRGHVQGHRRVLPRVDPNTASTRRSIEGTPLARRRIELRPTSIACARSAAVAWLGDSTQAASIRSRSAALEN